MTKKLTKEEQAVLSEALYHLIESRYSWHYYMPPTIWKEMSTHAKLIKSVQRRRNRLRWV